MSSLIWPVIGLIGIGGVSAFMWFLGFNYSAQRRMEAERQAELEKERADSERKTTEIFSRPRGDKSDVVGRL